MNCWMSDFKHYTKNKGVRDWVIQLGVDKGRLVRARDRHHAVSKSHN